MDAPLDWTQARERIGGSDETLREIAEVFLVEYPKMLGDIRTAIDEHADAELRRAAHTLKGSAALFVAGPVSNAALRLEQMGEEGNLADADSAWTELEAETERLASALRETLASEASGTEGTGAA